MASPQAYAGGANHSPTGYNTWVSPAHASYMYYPPNPSQADYQGQHGGAGMSTIGHHNHGARSAQSMERPGPGFSGANRELNTRSVPGKQAANDLFRR